MLPPAAALRCSINIKGAPRERPAGKVRADGANCVQAERRRRHDRAQDSVAAAADAARAVEDKAEQVETLAAATYAAGSIGWRTEAGKMVKELRKAVETLEDKSVASAALAKMAVVYGKHLERDRGRIVLQAIRRSRCPSCRA